MNLNKKAAIIGITALTSIAVMSSFVFGRDGLLSVAKATNDPYTMVLNKDTNTGLGNSFSNGTFSVNTPTGQSNVTFEYKNGKAKENGLITLNKTFLGNPKSDSPLYIGNTKPITGIESINVAFGSGLITIFGSADGTNYIKLDVLSSSGSTAKVENYLYFRIANGNQNKTILDIDSISFSYSCSYSLYSDEVTDLTNNTFQNANKSYSEVDTTTYMNGVESSKSVKMYAGEDTESQMNYVIPLGKTYTALEMKTMQLEFFVNGANNEAYNEKHNYFRFLVYPSKNWTKHSSYIQSSDIVNGSSWTKITADFASIASSFTNDEATFNSIYLRAVYVNDVNIDNMRLGYSDDYPTFDMNDILNQPEEINDISNNALGGGYNISDGGTEFEVVSQNSLCSRKINFLTQTTARWCYSGFVTDLTGMILSVDIKMDTLPSNAYAKVQIMKMVNNVKTRFEISMRNGTEAGVTKTALTGDYAGWIHYEVDIDAATEGASGTAKSDDAEYGLVIAHMENCSTYIDNLFINYPSVEI